MSKHISLSLLLLSGVFICSCSTQIQLREHTSYKITLTKGAELYKASDKHLGTAEKIELSDKTIGRIVYRDVTKNNISDAKVIIQNPTSGQPESYFLMPRTPFGKVAEFDYKTKFRTSYGDWGVFVNPFQFFVTTQKPVYYEPVELNKIRLGMYYGLTNVFHKYENQKYRRNSFTVGPYINGGFTYLSPTTYFKNLAYLASGRTVFGFNPGLLTSYSLDDRFGLGLLVGKEFIFVQDRADWLFHQNNVSLGLIFIFKFSKF